MLVGKATLNLKTMTIILLEHDRKLKSKNSGGNGEILVVKGSSRGRNHDHHGGSFISRFKSRP